MSNVRKTSSDNVSEEFWCFQNKRAITAFTGIVALLLIALIGITIFKIIDMHVISFSLISALAVSSLMTFVACVSCSNSIKNYIDKIDD